MKEKTKVNTKFNALYVGGLLALTVFMTKPVAADEWNKRTDFEFSGPVEIPGKVLPAGKYVFELADSSSDRNIVEVFSVDANGNQKLVTTVLAVPAYIENIPDKPVVHFEERHSGDPEAIRSYFYPGEHEGWEFIYPKGNGLETSANTTPASAPVTTGVSAMPAPAPADATAVSSPAPAPEAQQPAPAPAPEIQESATGPQVVVVEEDVVLLAQNDAPAPPPAQQTDTQGPDTQNGAFPAVLPQTAGFGDLGLMTGLAMLAGGTAVFAFRRKALALN
ncbi:MAG: hypothetical protein JWO19_148 [Bryobacterales bacterium]|nr:hypothetical protein [Bryobacterales bacterium]